MSFEDTPLLPLYIVACLVVSTRDVSFSHSNLSVGSEEDKEDEADAGGALVESTTGYPYTCLVQGYCRLNCKTKGGIGHCNIWKVIRGVFFSREGTLRHRVRQ